MRLLVSVVAVLASMSCAPASAQSPNVTWQHLVPLNGVRGQAMEMLIASNGDIVVAGHIPKPGSGTGNSQNDAWVARYSADGRELWSRTLGGYLRDEALGLAIDDADAVFITGWRYVQEVRQWSAFAAKYDADGALQWERTIGAAGERIATSDIALLEDGGVLVAGSEHLKDEAGSRPILARLSVNGDIRWRRQIEERPDPSIGGGPYLWRNGKPYASDRALITSVFTPRTAIIAIDRIDMMHGNILAGCLVVSLDDGGPTSDTCSNGVLDGFVPGHTYHGDMSAIPATADVVVTKFRSDGTVEWKQQPETQFGDGIKAVAETADSGVVAVGFQLNSSKVEFHDWDALIIRLDTDGREVWRHVFGGSRRDEFNDVAVLPDGSIVVVGSTGSQPGPVQYAPWIMRLNPQGELEGEALKELQERQF
jgi:uncharacterized delta-60 repeat protein